jgi:hypothetical protein
MNKEFHRSPMNILLVIIRQCVEIMIGSNDVGKIMPNNAENSPCEGMNGWCWEF